ncbi:MAG: carbohydrate ABC transporter permease [Candidatus Limnocylindrales bacterium]
MTAVAARAEVASVSRINRGRRVRRLALHAFLLIASLTWLFPLLYAVYTSFRPFADTGGSPHGYVSWPTTLTLDNYLNAWNQAELPRYFFNSLVIVIPAIIFVLLFASMMAFVVSRFSFRFNVLLLLLFTAANLLPPQVIITPLFRLYLALPLPDILNNRGLMYDSYLGVILIHIAFQLGFCTFVLSNYMKTLPRELNESAMVDGASVARIFWQIILPLTRPALAALATLEATWIYNDFFWALTLMSTPTKYPITSGLNNLKGQFFTDNNLVAAGSILVAIPTLIVFIVLQKQFVRGLTLGSTKG